MSSESWPRSGTGWSSNPTSTRGLWSIWSGWWRGKSWWRKLSFLQVSRHNTNQIYPLDWKHHKWPLQHNQCLNTLNSLYTFLHWSSHSYIDPMTDLTWASQLILLLVNPLNHYSFGNFILSNLNLIWVGVWTWSELINLTCCTLWYFFSRIR